MGMLLHLHFLEQEEAAAKAKKAEEPKAEPKKAPAKAKKQNKGEG